MRPPVRKTDAVAVQGHVLAREGVEGSCRGDSCLENVFTAEKDLGPAALRSEKSWVNSSHGGWKVGNFYSTGPREEKES